MDSKCYCSAIKRYAADIYALNSACTNLLYASACLLKMHNQAETYADTFRTAATPENVGAICAEIKDCGSQLYRKPIERELNKLDLIIKNLTSTHDSMVKADREYHNHIADSSDNNDMNPKTVPSGFIVSSGGKSRV